MVVIPGGTFLIGSPDSEAKCKKNESPQRSVAIWAARTRTAATRA
jgi:formylglycine-generating enzyme required for sulfatase activity